MTMDMTMDITMDICNVTATPYIGMTPAAAHIFITNAPPTRFARTPNAYLWFAVIILNAVRTPTPVRLSAKVITFTRIT